MLLYNSYVKMTGGYIASDPREFVAFKKRFSPSRHGRLFPLRAVSGAAAVRRTVVGLGSGGQGAREELL